MFDYDISSYKSIVWCYLRLGVFFFMVGGGVKNEMFDMDMWCFFNLIGLIGLDYIWIVENNDVL